MASFDRTPLAGQAQACGRLTQADGPEGPVAPVVTTGCYHCSKKKTNLTTLLDSCASSLRRAMPVFSVSFKKKKNCACHPCAGAMLQTSVYISRIVHVILAPGHASSRLASKLATFRIAQTPPIRACHPLRSARQISFKLCLASHFALRPC